MRQFQEASSADLNGSVLRAPCLDVVGVQDSVVTADSGDAVARVYREQGAKLWRSLLAYTGDREVASDAMAEALAQALGRGAAIESPDRWVWRAAFRIAAGELKNRSREERVSPTESGAYEMPEPPVDLIRALSKLSPNQRAVAILHIYADYRTRDIAKILGISQATVRVHLSQARRRLRVLLEDEDD
jgi:RNA polymerase sigma-70 factor, ECF subfamily